MLAYASISPRTCCDKAPGALDQFHQRSCSYEAFDEVDPKDSQNKVPY